VLKSDDSAISVGQVVNAERYGGRVRIYTGLIQSYKVLNQGVPHIGGKYAFFLTRSQQDLRILTGYELRQNKVKPLDSVNLFAVYNNVDVQSFMGALRLALVSPQPAPNVEYSILPDDGDPAPEPEPSGTPCAAPTPGQCTTPPKLDGPLLLKPNQDYTVIINPTGFDQDRIDAIRRGFEQWNPINGESGTGTGIRFVGFASSTVPPPGNCNYCIYVEGATDLHDSQGRKAEAVTGSQAASNTYPYISLVRMKIDFNTPLIRRSAVGCPTGQTWSYNVLEPTVAHEVGHPQGLNDCYPACTGSSIMGANDPKIQKPTPCDVQAVKSVYASGGGGSGSGGGEGGGMCGNHWGFWPVYNEEGDLIGYEVEYSGCF
jgi:hypothetical protein